MLTCAYIIGYLVSAVALSLWLLGGNNSLTGRLARLFFPLSMAVYLLSLLLLPLGFDIKLFILFRDLGLLALLSALIFQARFNQWLALALLVAALYLGYRWYLPVMLDTL